MRATTGVAYGALLLGALASATAAQDGASVTPPSLIEAPELTLPEGTRPPGDSVLLRLTIGPNGRVREAEIVEGLDERTDAAVLEAVQGLRFAPAIRDGEPITARITFRYRIAARSAPSSRQREEETAASTPHGEPGSPRDEDASAPDGVMGEEASEETALGVTVVVERAHEEGAAGRITLQGEELSTVPGTFGEPLRAVASLPGVARTPYGLGFFLVRGSDFPNTGFLVDGFAVPILYHVGAGPAILHTRFVDQMHFHAGNYPARYGRFSGGLIAIETAVPNLESPLGELSIDLTRASLFAATPFDEGRGIVAASVRRSYFELILPLVQPGLELSFTDYQALAQYRPDRRLTLKIFFFGADDRLDQSGQLGDGALISAGSRSAAGFDLQRLIATIRMDLTKGARLTLSGMVGRDATGFDTSQGFGLLHFQLEAFFGAWRAELDLPMNRELRARAGIDVSTLSAAILGTAPVPPGLGVVPSPLPTISTSDAGAGVIEAFAAAYYEQIVNLEPLELSAALRLDVMRYGDVLTPIFDPRVVARVKVHEAVTVKAASGLFVQQPSPYTIFRVGGNPSVLPERSWQSSAGFELLLPPGIQAFLTGFYNRQWNIPLTVDEIEPTATGLRRVFFRDDGEGHAFGLEAMLRMRHAGFYGWLSYTLSRAERWPAGATPSVFTFDQTHVLNLVASYGFDGWRFGLRFSLATGRPISSITGARWDGDTGGYTALRGSVDERLPYSHQLDLRIDRAFEVGPIRGSVFLDVMNTYFSELPEGLIYQYDYARSAILRGLPIIPTLGIRGTLQ